MSHYGPWTAARVMVPWVNDRKFLDLHARTAGRTLVSMDRCYILYAFAQRALKMNGAFAECGVYKGGTASILAGVAGKQKKLFLFDTFRGIPPGDPTKDNRYVNGGEFSETSFSEVAEFVRNSETDVEIREGLIPDTFSGVEGVPFSFVHLDLDIYKSVLDGLQFFYSRLCQGGVIIIDDYGFEECRGALLATEEFGEPYIPLPTGQALFIRS